MTSCFSHPAPPRRSARWPGNFPMSFQRHAVQRGTRRHAGFENSPHASGKQVSILMAEGELQYPAISVAQVPRADGHAEPPRSSLMRFSSSTYMGLRTWRWCAARPAFADEAAQQVQLVRAGTGNDEVCLIRSAPLNLPGSAVALHDHHVQPRCWTDPAWTPERSTSVTSCFPLTTAQQGPADFSRRR